MRTFRLPLLALILAGTGLGASAAPDMRVVDAAEKKDAQAVSALVKQGADVNIAQGDGGTALHWAAHWDDVAMAKRLIAAGARVDAANDYGVTPLFLAASNGNADMAGVLLDAGANAKAALPSGETVLMTAVTGGNAAVVKRLLAKGANPNATQASKGQTALMWASTGQNVEAARALIEAGADVKARSGSGFTALHFAAREGNAEITKLLLAAKADVNESAADGTTPLLVAAVRGHVDLAIFLLDQGARPDGNADAGYTPLHWAVSEQDITPITYNDIEAPGEWRTLTGIPDREKKFTLIRTLIARGADINAVSTKTIPQMAPFGGTGMSAHSGITPFFAAAASADAEVMRLLLANGADPFIRSRDGYTPLMAASEGIVENSFRLTEDRRIKAVQVALEAGNDIEDREPNKEWRAMHVAARSGYHNVIKFLLANGADLNPRTKRFVGSGLANYIIEPQTPLGLVEGTITSIFYERPETAAFLLSLGAKSEGAFNQNDYLAPDRVRKEKAAAAAGQ